MSPPQVTVRTGYVFRLGVRHHPEGLQLRERLHVDVPLLALRGVLGLELCGLGLEVRGWVFVVCGLVFGVWCLVFGFWLSLRVQVWGFGATGPWFGVSESGLQVPESGRADWSGMHEGVPDGRTSVTPIPLGPPQDLPRTLGIGLR